jgi:nicotinamidase-related amidase
MAPALPTKVISAAHRFREPLPVLVLLDMQKQHLAGSPQHVVGNAASVVDGCQKLLAVARTTGIPVAHTKRLEGDTFFNPESPLTDWVAECRPIPHEMLYEHTAPSIYSVQSFARFFEHIQSPLIVLAGFGASYTGLATAIDGFSRGHRIWFVGDASGSGGGAAIDHRPVCTIIGQFADIIDLSSALTRFQERSRGHYAHG